MTRLRLQKLLGGLWLLDGVLQLQPGMFTMNMIQDVIMPNLNGQPPLLRALLSWSIPQVTAHLVIANLAAAGIQILIGLLLLTNRLVRPTLLLSFLWGLLVWVFGEGLGGLLTGSATLLTGAPGAALLYVGIGAMVYPLPHRQGSGQTKEMSLLSRTTGRRLLGLLFLLGDILQLQPKTLAPDFLSRAIAANIGGAPAVDASLRFFAAAAAEHGLVLGIGIMGVEAVMGISLLGRDGAIPVVIPIILLFSFVLWWVGEGFGMLFSGMATDPNTGPLLVLWAVAVAGPIAASPVGRRPQSGKPRRAGKENPFPR